MISSTTTSPKIGSFYTYCCLEDMHKIKTQDDIDKIIDDIENDEEPIPSIYESIEKVITANWYEVGFSQDEINAHIERLKNE